MECRKSNACNTLWDSDRSEGFAIRESPISNARNGVRDNRVLASSNKCVGRFLDNCVAVVAAIVFGITSFYYHRGEGGARTESTYSNARNAVRNSNRGEGGAKFESSIPNARNAIRDGNRSEGGATIESFTPNARDAIRDGDGSEGGALTKSPISNARDAVRDGDRSEGGATRESPISNALNTISDSDRGEGFTLVESNISNARNAIRNSDRGEGGAIIESRITNARNWTIEGDDTLAVLVFVANDICAEDISFIWCNHCAINRGIQDLPCRVNAYTHILLVEIGNIISPIRTHIVSFSTNWNIRSIDF